MVLVCSSRGLPQLAVLAKILCLLMVVMCGAVPSAVPSDINEVISLFSTCSRGNVTVSTKVRTSEQNSENAPYQLLQSKSHSVVRVSPTELKVKLYLYADKVGKYLCFNKHGKIVAKKKTNEMCLFYETYYGRYLRYVSTEDQHRFLGFNKGGKPIAWPRGSSSCYNFVRYKHVDGIENHNKIKSHKLRSLTSSQQQQQQQPPHLKSLHRNSNSLVHHRNKDRTRHRHEWSRRQHLQRQQQPQQHHKQQQQQQQQQLRPYQESKY